MFSLILCERVILYFADSFTNISGGIRIPPRSCKSKRITVKASFFDIDGVVYEGSLGIDFMRHLQEKGIIAESFISKILEADSLYKARVLDGIKYLKICANLWKKSILGCEVKTINSEAEHCVQKVYGKISKNALKLIESDRFEGFRIIGVTGSPIEIAAYVSKLLNFDSIVATRVSVKNGRYTGRLLRPWPVGKGKAQAVLQISSKFNIDLTASKAYGDSENDIEMLKIVGEPITVNPDKRLEKYAIKQRWKIIRW